MVIKGPQRLLEGAEGRRRGSALWPIETGDRLPMFFILGSLSKLAIQQPSAPVQSLSLSLSFPPPHSPSSPPLLPRWYRPQHRGVPNYATNQLIRLSVA